MFSIFRESMAGKSDSDFFIVSMDIISRKPKRESYGLHMNVFLSGYTDDIIQEKGFTQEGIDSVLKLLSPNHLLGNLLAM